MFTWICPQCGREVPPSYTDCPDCAAKTNAPPPQPPAPPMGFQPAPPQYPPPAAEPPQYQPPPSQYQYPPQYQPQYQPQQQYPPPPQYQSAPQYPPQQQYPAQPYPPVYQQPQQPPPPKPPQPPPPPPAQAQTLPEPPKFYEPPPERSGLAALPTWLMSILFALVFGGVVYGAYTLYQTMKKEPTAATRESAGALESPSVVTATGAAKNNPLVKQIEIAGLRLTQNKAQKTEIRFLVVNHSAGEIQDVAGTLSLRARTSKKDEEPVGACAFKLASLGPYESKDMVAVLNTKLKVYELPDWQNLQAQLEITSP